jgi:hypothetical protein
MSVVELFHTQLVVVELPDVAKRTGPVSQYPCVALDDRTRHVGLFGALVV